MKVLVRKHIPLEKLISEVRSVPLKSKDPNSPKVFPYQKARIVLREMFWTELNPGSKYLLQDRLESLRDMRLHLLGEHGIDPLKLTGGYELDINGEVHMLIPPIVEVSEEKMIYHDTRGDIKYDHPIEVKMNIVVDGLHRISLARYLENSVNVLHVQGIPPECPFYALANEWKDVKIVQEIPKTNEEKKDYRRKDSYDLYRDFGILGCGAPRGTGTGK